MLNNKYRIPWLSVLLVCSILSMALCSCFLTIAANGTETLWYRTAPINFYTLFPVAIAGRLFQ